MDRAVLQDHLAAIDRHIVEAECQIANQRERVAQLERDGHETALDTELLKRFEEVLDLNLADRDRLRKERGALGEKADDYSLHCKFALRQTISG
jgi:hypothetical protein